jgi:hypothetical protein
MWKCGLSHDFAAPFHTLLPYHRQATCDRPTGSGQNRHGRSADRRRARHVHASVKQVPQRPFGVFRAGCSRCSGIRRKSSDRRRSRAATSRGCMRLSVQLESNAISGLGHKQVRRHVRHDGSCSRQRTRGAVRRDRRRNLPPASVAGLAETPTGGRRWCL